MEYNHTRCLRNKFRERSKLLMREKAKQTVSAGCQALCGRAMRSCGNQPDNEDMKMKKMNIAFSVSLACMLTGPVSAGDTINGEQMFQYHGCSNCHGADAKTPVSKVVPVLAGKPADELYSKAKKILSGEGASKESEIMHAAFYSPSECDHPPTDAELQAITGWIAEL
jgi:cytochrome c553